MMGSLTHATTTCGNNTWLIYSQVRLRGRVLRGMCQGKCADRPLVGGHAGVPGGSIGGMDLWMDLWN